MMRSLYSAVSGLRTHQTRMDVIADNVANVNTTAFKKSRVTFQDVFYQTLRGGSAPAGDGTRGGTNPRQIGLGVSLASIDVLHTQGAAQMTGNGTDLMIQGDGFFILTDGTNYFYTRAGAFAFDAGGNLVNPANGLKVVACEGSLQIDPNAQGYSFDTMGRLSYVDANGVVQSNVGTIAIAKFPNPGGLIKVGENLYRWSDAAGDEVGGNNETGGPPGGDGRGTIIPGALEMSNVELAQEFTDMIVTQRGFQANARVITVSDEMLQELANLKR